MIFLILIPLITLGYFSVSEDIEDLRWEKYDQYVYEVWLPDGFDSVTGKNDSLHKTIGKIITSKRNSNECSAVENVKFCQVIRGDQWEGKTLKEYYESSDYKINRIKYFFAIGRDTK